MSKKKTSLSVLESFEKMDRKQSDHSEKDKKSSLHLGDNLSRKNTSLGDNISLPITDRKRSSMGESLSHMKSSSLGDNLSQIGDRRKSLGENILLITERKNTASMEQQNLPVISSVPSSFYSVSGFDVSICQKCNNIYDDPRVLSCLHSFCKKCISDMVNKVDFNSVIRCPICRCITDCPENGIEDIPVNLYLEHEAVIAGIERRIVGPTLPPCDECARDPHDDTASFCCTCTSFLCLKCHSQHVLSRKAHLHHKVLLLDDTTNMKAKLRQNMTFLPSTCPVHLRQEISLFCEDCNQLACIQCCLSKHPAHKVEDLVEFIKRQKRIFCEDVKDLPEMICRLDDLMNSGRIVCDNVKLREHTISDSINKVFEELHQSLDMRKAYLEQQCAEIVTAKLDKLTIQIEDISILKESIMTCSDFVSSCNDAYDESEFVSILTTLDRRIESIKANVKSAPRSLAEDDAIHFNSDSAIVQNSVAVMGDVFVLKHQNFSSLHDPINVVKTSNAYHVAIHRSGDYIVANHIGDSIEIYDSTGVRKNVFGMSGVQPGHFKRPLGVTVVGDNIYIVEFNGNRCQKMTIDGEFLCEIAAGQLAGAWGCAVSKTGVLYVAEEGSNRVQAFAPDGKRLKILCSSPAVYAPRDVAIDKYGKINVAACGSKSVKVFDPNGTFVREYGNGLVSEPSGVAVDQLGFCFVADWGGKCLHVFDQVGKVLSKLEFDGCISGVSIDDNNHVHVVNHSAQTISKY